MVNKSFTWQELLDADLTSMQVARLQWKLESLGFSVARDGGGHCPHCGEDYDKSLRARAGRWFAFARRGWRYMS